MTEESAEATRLLLAGLDREILAQARADREHQQELARIESQKVTSLEKMRSQALADRRQRIGWALAGLAIVIVILAIVAAIWTAVDRDRQKNLQREQLRQQTAQECIRAGNILTADGACLITQRDAPAPANPTGE
jgi:hypothetical protein